MIYIEKGNQESALDCYRESLRIIKMACGDNHLSIAETQDQIGTIYMTKKEHRTALSCFEDSARIKKMHLDPNDPGMKETKDKLKTCQQEIDSHVRVVSSSRLKRSI